MIYEHLISLGHRLQSISRNQELRQYIILALLPMIVIGGYYIWQSHEEANQPTQVLSANAQNTTPSNQTKQPEPTEEQRKEIKKIKVDVSGAVVKPGLKELSDGARVADALKLAGGLNNQADKQYIAQVLNLAQKLSDGDKIYLPTYYEVSLSIPTPVALLDKADHPLKVLASAKTTQDSSDSGDKKEDLSDSGLINVNTATQSQLESLPGIGPVYAQKIIDHRTYTDKSEVCGEEIINNSSTCEKIKDLIET